MQITKNTKNAIKCKICQKYFLKDKIENHFREHIKLDNQKNLGFKVPFKIGENDISENLDTLLKKRREIKVDLENEEEFKIVEKPDFL